MKYLFIILLFMSHEMLFAHGFSVSRIKKLKKELKPQINCVISNQNKIRSYFEFLRKCKQDSDKKIPASGECMSRKYPYLINCDYPLK